MSNRLLKRGRYPKVSGADQVVNTNSSIYTAPLTQPTPAVSLYDPSAQPQIAQNAWTPDSYSNSNPTNFQSSQPVIESTAGYWSAEQVHPIQQQPWSNSWNNGIEHQQTSNVHTVNPSINYSQTPDQHTINAAMNYSQNSNLHVIDHTGNYPPTSDLHNVNLATNYLQQTSEQCTVDPITKYPQTLPPNSTINQWTHQTQYMTNQNYSEQDLPGYEQPQQQIYQSQADHQINQNLNDPNTQWSGWNHNISEVPQDPSSFHSFEIPTVDPSHANVSQWSYNNHPFSESLPDSVSINNDSAMWQFNSTAVSDYVTQECTRVDGRSLETVNSFKEPSVNLQPQNQKESSLNPQPSDQKEPSHSDSFKLNYVIDSSNGQKSEENCAASTLSAFFHDSDHSQSSERQKESPMPFADEVVTENSSQENSFPLEVDGRISNSESDIEEANPDSSFEQEELAVLDKSNSKSNVTTPVGFSEEPGNQEVPEPNLENSSETTNSTVTENNKEIIIDPEEPQNQQIPPEFFTPSRSTSAERERVIIRPREESPFKPPRPSSSKSSVPIVQQEMSMPSCSEPKSNDDKTVSHEVNLETYPDNLERPLDYEELHKQSPFRKQREAANQKRLRNEVNSSPTSLLVDNPDIPCVTLAPAAPPISSAKSDKSESSTDSKLGSISLKSSNLSLYKLNESNLKSSSYEIPKIDDHKNNDIQSKKIENPADRPSRSRKLDVSSSSRSEESYNLERDYKQSGYLKDSKINGSNQDSFHRSAHPPVQKESDFYYRKNSGHHSTQKDSHYDSDTNNQSKFSDEKYAPYDERQYYSDRERSRHSSRSSMRDPSEEFSYQQRTDHYSYTSTHEDPRKFPPNDGRPSSRSSESGINRRDRQNYYKESYPYPPDPRYRNQDYYQRNPNNRGYDYDLYHRNYYASSYYDPYQFAYSNYHYGFYDELYRNDPRYQQYQQEQYQHEQYRQYYEKLKNDEYERLSVHSGHSSLNELSKDATASQYSEPGLDSNESEMSAYNLGQPYSNENYNEMSNHELDKSSTPSTRLTPVKFSYAHPIARFSPGGQLISVIPNQSNHTSAVPIRIHNLQEIRENEESFKELKCHQGPLVRGSTHKNDVIEFCSQKVKVICSKEDIVDRNSTVLLWKLMILLLRQNGSVVGSDIAELLLKDHEVLQPLASLKQVETPQSEQSPADVNDLSSQLNIGDASSPDEGIVVSSDKTILNTSKTVDIDNITRKFREFLMFGHKKDALEWAMKHGLWGHALFMASKMDNRTHANVMIRFANSLALNDPLQTLYQLMSGRQPLAVTNVADKKWGDWRPHLAMILSNPSSAPEVDSRSITTLGDTLANKGCLSAAHFCYIMSQVEFGSYEQKGSKIVLLSSDHELPFEEFSTNEAIQITEIYEYARSLADQSFILVHLQFYKFLYAMRLVEHGFLEEALHYAEIIADKLLENSHLFQFDFICDVFKLATLLKYHDPHFLRGQGEYEDQDDPEWLRKLSGFIQNYSNIVASHNVQYCSENSENQNLNVSSLQYSSPQTENFPSSILSSSTLQQDVSNASYHSGYYHPDGLNQQSNFQSSTYASNGQAQPSYYSSDISSNRGSFQRDNSLPSHEENETTDIPSSPVTQMPFDYYASNKQEYDNKPLYESSGGFNNALPRERRDSALSSGSRYSTGSTSVANKNIMKEAVKPDIRKEKANTQAGKTWLGGIFSKLLPKAPNQMILPDDKNPTILWDEKKSCWVNKDSNDDDENNSPIAPPTDSELMGFKSSSAPFHGSSVPASSLSNALPLNGTVPSSGPPPSTLTTVPPLNKFQRSKTRGMRQNYVDVFNPVGATSKSNALPEGLFPSSLEPVSSPNMFIPGSTDTIGESPEEYGTNQKIFDSPPILDQSQQQMQTGPVMYDPTQLETQRPSLSKQRNTLARSGRRQYPT